MLVLCLDLGSSGVRAGLYDTHTLAPTRPPSTALFADGPVTPARVRETLRSVLAGLGDLSAVEMVSPGSFSPSLCLLGDAGLDDLPILSHADRRSLEQARRVELVIGPERFLATVGNRPVPGGISVTSLLWLMDHEPAAVARAAGIGHLTTWLGHELTGRLAMDYSHASFTGLMDVRRRAWSAPLVNELGLDPRLLPTLRDASELVGRVTPAAARAYGLPAGIPVLTGLIDTSAAILCTDLSPGTLVHSIGTTDVLALVVEQPSPDPHWLTRHVGTADRWLAVVTLAAGGSTLDWLHRVLFSELPREAFHDRVRAALQGLVTASPPAGAVRFDPHLAGSRLAVEQPTAAFSGLTLATTRDDLLAAALAAYRDQTRDSLARLSRLRAPRGWVLVTGGASPIADLLHADWPAAFTYHRVADANLRGLAVLAERAGG